jgi:tetratricopeptide (TPR) repeat protein
MSKPHPRKTRGMSRPWIVPPGLLVQGEPFEGYHVLDETRDELGVLLWQCLRDVEVWAMAPPEQRRYLFTAGALRQRMERIEEEVAPTAAVRPVLEGLASLLARPSHMTSQEVCELCEELSRWASDAGLPRTALAFAQRGAMAAPEEAGPAYLVGLISRRAADYRRAEVWFRRCLAIARHTGDWKHYGLAHMGLANLYMQRGDAPKARARLLRALRSARRYGVWTVKPFALHDLFLITATGDDPRLAEQYARAAYRAYGRRHPRLPALAHDVAWFWMLQRQFNRALPIFEAVVRHFTRPAERMLVLSNIARAAGGACEYTIFDRAWTEVWRMVDDSKDRERVAEALVNLSHGAAALGQVVRMEMAASYAQTIAMRRKESQQQIEAEDLLALAASMYTRPQENDAYQAEDAALAPASDWFADELVEALAEVSVL